MAALFSRTNRNFSASICFVLLCFFVIGQAQSQVLPVSGNSQVTENAAVLFSTGAREIVVDGMFDFDKDTFGAGDGPVQLPFGGTRVTFDALDGNSSAISIDLQNEAGTVIGTFTSSGLEDLTISSASGGSVYTAAFTFANPLFTSTDPGTANIGGGNNFTISISDFEFAPAANSTAGLNPGDFFANVADGSFTLDAAEVDIFFANGETNVIERIDVSPSDPNQQFTLGTTPTLLGDVNLDGRVSFLDITPFIAILSSEGFLEEADINGDSLVNFLDITPFVGILSGT